MKKYIALIASAAMLTAVFAQTVEVTNKLSTSPGVAIGTSDVEKSQWGFRNTDNEYEPAIREQVEGKALSEDERAGVWARARFNVKWTDPTKINTLASPTSDWVFASEVAANGSIKFGDSFVFGLGTELGEGYTKEVIVGPEIPWEEGTFFLLGTTRGVDKKPNCLAPKPHKVITEGAYIAFSGVKNLTFTAGIETSEKIAGGFALIKKNYYGVFGIGAKYSTDAFDIGASYKFGQTSKSDITQAAYIGATIKALQNLPVSITIDVMGTALIQKTTEKNTSEFAVGADIDFDFNNGIKTKPFFTIVFNTGSDTYQELPFSVGNTLTYKHSDFMTFKLLTSYTQIGLTDKMKSYTGINGTGLMDSAFIFYPELELTSGRSTFNLGIKTTVNCTRGYVEKTDVDYGHETIYGKAATVVFPISWTYRF